MTTPPPADSNKKDEKFVLTTSRLFPSWLASTGASIVFTTYQAGKVFLIGTNPSGQISIFERTIERPMALATDGDALYISSLYQLWRFQNVARDSTYEGYDRLFAPRASWVTGDIDIHDVKVDKNGQVLFVNTLFSCIASPSESDSFNPVWQPPFISKLAAEDRCHLNGMAMRDGEPAFVTAVGATNAADGWREKRRDGGIVVDVKSGETITTGLSMPHAPRWHNGRLYVLNAGTGEFGEVDLDDGKFRPISFCQGFLRGLDFVGDYAVLTMSLPRGNRTFEGLALQDTLDRLNAEPRCGISIIDLNSGDVVHWLRIEGIVSELFDVAVLPGVKRPAMIGFRSDEIRRMLSIGPGAN